MRLIRREEKKIRNDRIRNEIYREQLKMKYEETRKAIRMVGRMLFFLYFLYI